MRLLPKTSPGSRQAAPTRHRTAQLLWTVPLAAVLNLFAASACKDGRDDSNCLDARMHAREAADRGPLEEAKRHLLRARSACGRDSQIYLDQIEERVKERRETEQKGEHEEPPKTTPPAPQRSMLARFLFWVKRQRDSVAGDIQGVECAAADSDDYGFCEAHHPSERLLRVRFWDVDKSAFRFTFTAQTPLSCHDLGAHRLVRRWTVNERALELCELTDHELRSLSALVERSGSGYRVDVFSHSYAAKDRKFQQSLGANR